VKGNFLDIRRGKFDQKKKRKTVPERKARGILPVLGERVAD